MRFILLLILSSFHASASVPLQLSDKQLASKTDHVFEAHVVGVDMIDDKGHQVTNDKAMTGPGLTNTIRLKVKIDKILVTNSKKVPEYIFVPLDSFMHYRLGQVKKAHEGKNPQGLFLLSGKQFSPPLAGVFRRPLEKKSYFVKHVKKKHTTSTNKVANKQE